MAQPNTVEQAARSRRIRSTSRDPHSRLELPQQKRLCHATLLREIQLLWHARDPEAQCLARPGEVNVVPVELQVAGVWRLGSS
jgi:hypothetical protein